MADIRQVREYIDRQARLDRIYAQKPRMRLVPHDRGQIQFLQSRHKIRIAIPGNGWGKTTTMAMAIDMAIQKDDPFNPDMLPKHPVLAAWVCTKFQQFSLIKQQVEQEVWTAGWQWNDSKHCYTWPNGGQLHVISSDSNWEHIQGVPLDMVGFDEHPNRKLWNELLFRRRGRRKTRYMVAATMTLGMTWFIKEVIQPWEKYHRNLSMRAEEARKAQKHPEVWVWDAGGIRDNPIMTAEDISHYENTSTMSEKELLVRLKGGYADFSGETVFSREALDEMVPDLEDGEDGRLIVVEGDLAQPQIILPDGYDAKELLRKRRVGGHTKGKYVNWLKDADVDGGTITIWKPPEGDGVYTMGADFAAGLVGRDFDYAVVLRKRQDGKLEQVAEAKGWWGDVDFCEILFMLGTWYFNAFLCGERQFGLPTMRRLYDEKGYVWVLRQRFDASRSRRPSDLLGHHRHAGDTIIPNLQAAVKRLDLVIKSKTLMQELRQYQYRPRSKTMDSDTARSSDLITSAPEGMHDDGVMALAYAIHAAREAGKYELPKPGYAPGTYGHTFEMDKILEKKNRNAIRI